MSSSDDLLVGARSTIDLISSPELVGKVFYVRRDLLRYIAPRWGYEVVSDNGLSLLVEIKITEPVHFLEPHPPYPTAPVPPDKELRRLLQHERQRTRASYRAGVRFAITWLHNEAATMVDDRARHILNAAGYHLGLKAKHSRPEFTHSPDADAQNWNKVPDEPNLDDNVDPDSAAFWDSLLRQKPEPKSKIVYDPEADRAMGSLMEALHLNKLRHREDDPVRPLRLTRDMVAEIILNEFKEWWNKVYPGTPVSNKAWPSLSAAEREPWLRVADKTNDLFGQEREEICASATELIDVVQGMLTGERPKA